MLTISKDDLITRKHMFRYPTRILELQGSYYTIGFQQGHEFNVKDINVQFIRPTILDEAEFNELRKFFNQSYVKSVHIHVQQGIYLEIKSEGNIYIHEDRLEQIKPFIGQQFYFINALCHTNIWYFDEVNSVLGG